MAVVKQSHLELGGEGGPAIPYRILLDSSGVATSPALEYVVSAVVTATVTVTATLATAFSTTLPADLVRIVLIPRGDVYWAVGGAATASSSLIGQGSFLSLPVTKTLADTIQVFSAGAGAAVDLLVCTPR